MEAIHFKKATQEKLYFKTSKKEKNRIKQRVDFMIHPNKVRNRRNYDFGHIVNNKQEHEFYQGTQVSATNSNGHKHQKEVEKQ